LDFNIYLLNIDHVKLNMKKAHMDKWRFNVTQFKDFFCIFCERQISIKLLYLYQRLQCTDNYFFKIKFVLFLYLLLSVSWKENDLSWYISVIRQTVGRCVHIYLIYIFKTLEFILQNKLIIGFQHLFIKHWSCKVKHEM
jgi:hypothetical protein